MNNIPINTNNDNNENEVKKPSKKKKVLTVILIIMVVLFISNVLTKLTVGATDISYAMNGAQELTFEPIGDIAVSDGTYVGSIGECTQVEYTSIDYDIMSNSVLFKMDDVSINASDDPKYIYVSFVIRAMPDVNAGYKAFSLMYKENGTVYGSGTFYSYVGNDYTIITLILKTSYSNTDYTYLCLDSYSNHSAFDVKACYIGTNQYKIAENALARCKYENEVLNPPTDVVYGTEDILVTAYSTYTEYEAQGIVVPWDVYNLGIIASAVIDGISVNMTVHVVINKDSLQVGNIVILDEAYNGYIFEVDLEGSAEYGRLKFSILNTTEFDVKYVAISDNYTLLSEHIVAKVNEYNDFGDSESYQAGYADGFKVGQQSASIGAFANTQLDVQWSIREVATGLVYEFYQQYPIAVNAGGISFEDVWYWYINSSYNDRAYEVQEINFYITFTNENTLFKNSSFWWGNQSKSEVFLPYATYLVPTNISITNKLAVIEKYGDYFYITCDDLVDNPIEQIRFTISNDNASYYDIFITNKLTLYTDINQTIIDNQSYFLGEVKGIEYGEKVGYEKGEKDGYDNGYQVAYEDAKRDFYEKGFTAGRDEGYDVGFLQGREQGMNEEFSFYMIPTSIMDAISSTFFGWLDFEFFGVNMASFVLQLMTIAVFAWIWKKVA